ncbi:hypothetical protein EAS54_31870 [Bradyrhizobium guangzhouense]|nr:hypothetical protein EAS54_31870 [Bradyrhizobium guangzhouense]
MVLSFGVLVQRAFAADSAPGAKTYGALMTVTRQMRHARDGQPASPVRAGSAIESRSFREQAGW